jgi:hypothetical protein
MRCDRLALVSGLLRNIFQQHNVSAICTVERAPVTRTGGGLPCSCLARQRVFVVKFEGRIRQRVG